MPEWDDDTPIGRLLTRREMLQLSAATGAAAFLAACGADGPGSPSPTAAGSTTAAGPTTAASPTVAASRTVSGVPACVVKPELTEGPYFLDEQMERSDIRSDADGTVSEGVPLALTFAVSRIDGSACQAFEGAVVDLWHCDALGSYSGVSGPGNAATGDTYLRGFQRTAADGTATFTTIYPGWYQGRAVHMHVKIRSDPDAASGLEFTSQLFFDEAVTDEVHAREPYSQKGRRDVTNDSDNIYGQSGGQLLLDLDGDAASGFEARFEIGVQVA